MKIFCISFILSCFLLAVSAADLIKNGSFSAGTANWQLNAAEDKAITVDSKIKQNDNSLKITHQSMQSYSTASQAFPVKPNTNYRASGWVKTEKIAKSAQGLGAVIFIGDNNGNYVAQSDSFSGDRDWTFQSILFNSKDQRQMLIIPYLHHSTGSVWFDELTIEEQIGKPSVPSGAIPSDLKHWTMETAQPEAITNDTATRCMDLPTIKFNHPTFARSKAFINVQVTPHTNYLVSAMFKLNCPYLRERGYSGLQLMAINPVTGHALATTPPQTAISDWRTRDFAFNSGELTRIQLALSIYDGDGQAWVGNINVQEISNPAFIGDITPSPANTLNRSDYPAKAVIFQSGSDEVLYSNFVPAPAQIGTIESAAASGEITNFALSVYAFESIKNLTVSQKSEFTNSDGAKIPDSNVQIRYLADAPFQLDPLRYYSLPIFLKPNRMLDLAALHQQRYFIGVEVPPGTPEGIYRAKFQFKGEGFESDADVQLKVYPFDLPKPEITYLMYHNTAFTEAVSRDMARHGMNSVTIYDSFEMNGNQPSTLLSWIPQLMKNTGLADGTNPLLYLYCNPKDWIATFSPPVEKIKMILDYQKSRNLPEILIYCVDEPNAPERIKEAKDAINKIRAAVPEVKIVTAIGRDGLAGGLVDYYDVLILDSMDMTPEMADLIKNRTDKKFWLYECRLNGKTPLVDRYSYGVFCYASGAAGFAQWIYNDSKRASDSATTIVYGHNIVDGENIFNSLGFEAKRKGIDDYRYIQLLQSLIAEYPETDEAAAALATLNEIKSTIQFDSFARRQEKMDGVEFRLDNHAQDNLGIAELTNWRQRIADHIIKLPKKR